LLKIFGPKSEEEEEGWRRIHNEELRNLYSSPNVIRAIKSMRMRWASYVTCIEEIRNAYKILVEKVEGKSNSEDLGLDRRIILECILGEWCGKVWTVLIWLRIRTSGGLP
jgi:hypothetical protein